MQQPCLRPLVCPICQQPFQENGQVWRCPTGHSFDMAREGYVNLLLSHKKLAPTVGDSAEMLQARRQFLASGFYQPLSDRLNELALAQVTGQAGPVVVDVGCGEGFYLRRLGERLPAAACRFGLDVAKTAVRLAAKQDTNGRYLVADVQRPLPFESASVQLLLNVFAPRHPAEFSRILAPDGSLFLVFPTPAHLYSLRQQFGLLGIQPEKEAQIEQQFLPYLAVRRREWVEYPMKLGPEMLRLLLLMTPNARHLTAGQWGAVAATTAVETVASFTILQLTQSS